MALLDNMKDIMEISEKKGKIEPGFSEDALETYRKLFEEGDFFEILREEDTECRGADIPELEEAS